jgi:hypothetical protein
MACKGESQTLTCIGGNTTAAGTATVLTINFGMAGQVLVERNSILVNCSFTPCITIETVMHQRVTIGAQQRSAYLFSPLLINESVANTIRECASQAL